MKRPSLLRSVSGCVIWIRQSRVWQSGTLRSNVIILIFTILLMLPPVILISVLCWYLSFRWSSLRFVITSSPKKRKAATGNCCLCSAEAWRVLSIANFWFVFWLSASFIYCSSQLRQFGLISQWIKTFCTLYCPDGYTYCFGLLCAALSSHLENLQPIMH